MEGQKKQKYPRSKETEISKVKENEFQRTGQKQFDENFGQIKKLFPENRSKRVSVPDMITPLSPTENIGRK